MEQLRTRERRQLDNGGGFPGDDDADPQGATVISGPYSQTLQVAGMTVGRIRERLATRLDIDPHSLAVIDGQDVTDETVVGAGQLLTFVTRAGEKGMT